MRQFFVFLIEETTLHSLILVFYILKLIIIHPFDSIDATCEKT